MQFIQQKKWVNFQCKSTAVANIHIIVGHRDIPLLANLNELERKALPAKCVKEYLSSRENYTGPKPATE